MAADAPKRANKQVRSTPRSEAREGLERTARPEPRRSRARGSPKNFVQKKLLSNNQRLGYLRIGLYYLYLIYAARQLLQIDLIFDLLGAVLQYKKLGLFDFKYCFKINKLSIWGENPV
jgi:hypothetical protein